MLLSVLSLSAQETTLKLYGFIRQDMYIDTYKGIDGIKEMCYLYPNFQGIDNNGDDFNEQLSANFIAVASRMGAAISGPEILGAKSSAKMEFDFCGKPNYSVFRIRHAFVSLKWENSDFLVGQTWHPLFGGTVYANTVSLNTGAPFQPFNRSPQMRFNYHVGGATISGTASFDLQYMSMGPDKFSDQYKRNGVIPDLTFGIEHNNDDITFGFAASYRRIKPRTETYNGEYVSKDFLNSMIGTIYGRLKSGNLMVTLKSTLSQNGSHLLMIGGYGVASRDADTGAETYTNYNNLSSFVNIVYGKEFKVGCLGALSKNLGTTDGLQNINGNPLVWGLGNTIQDMSRVSVFSTRQFSKLTIGLEYEMTAANFGVDGFDFSDGLYNDTHEAINHRVLLNFVYNF